MHRQRRDAVMKLVARTGRVDLAMSACDRIVVLVEGHVIADGTPDEVRADKRVVGAYLGEEGAA